MDLGSQDREDRLVDLVDLLDRLDLPQLLQLGLEPVGSGPQLVKLIEGTVLKLFITGAYLLVL